MSGVHGLRGPPADAVAVAHGGYYVIVEWGEPYADDLVGENACYLELLALSSGFKHIAMMAKT